MFLEWLLLGAFLCGVTVGCLVTRWFLRGSVGWRPFVCMHWAVRFCWLAVGVSLLVSDGWLWPGLPDAATLAGLDTVARI